MVDRLGILLVDDDEDEYILLRKLMRGQRYLRSPVENLDIELDWVDSYEGALEKCQSEEYDVFLFDYYLGAKNGLELLKDVRARGCKTPAIILTGHGDSQLDLAVMESGAADYLVKDALTGPLLERAIRYSIERQVHQDSLEYANQELEKRIQERTADLAASERRFRRLTETTSAAIFIIQDRIIRYANPAVRDVTGYDPEELTGQPIWQIAHPDYRNLLRHYGIANQWNNMGDVENALPTRYELKLETKEGELRWVDLTAGAIEVDGQPAWIVTAFDITERDKAEQAIRRAKEELEMRVAERTSELRQANRRMAESNSLLDAILKTQPAAVWVADETGRIVQVNAMVYELWGLGAPRSEDISDYRSYRGWWADTGEKLAPEDWALARAVQSGETAVGDIVDIERFDGTRATLMISAAPIFEEGRIIGGVAVAQDITGQRRLERQARQRAEELNKVFDAMSEAVLVFDTGGVLQRANPAAVQIYGFEPHGMMEDEIIDKIRFRYPNGDPVPTENRPVNRALQSETVRNERYCISAADGREIHIVDSASPLLDASGEITGALVVWRDITGYIQVIEENRRHRELLERVFELAPVAVAVVNEPDLQFEYANPAYRSLLPDSNQDPLGRLFSEVWPVEFASDWSQLLHDVLSSGQPHSETQYEIRLPGGGPRYFSYQLVPMEWEGSPAVSIVVWETTELVEARQQAQEAAAEARRRAEEMDAVFQAMAEIVILFDADGIPSRCNPAARRSLGFDISGLSHQDYIERLGLQYPGGQPVPPDQAPSQRALMGERVINEEFSLLYADGKRHSIQLSVSLIHSREGQLIGAVAVWADITERRHLLDQLALEQARMQAIFENAPEGIVVCDAEARVLQVNAVARDLYNRPVPVGQAYQSHADMGICYPDGTPYDPRDLPMTRAALDGEITHELEMLFKWPDGQQRFMLVNASPIRDSENQITGAVGVFQDITQRRQSEARLREHARRVEVLATLSQAFATAGSDYQPALDDLAHSLVSHLCDSCIVRLVSEDGNSLVPAAYFHHNPKMNKELLGVLRLETFPGRDNEITSGLMNGKPLLMPFVPRHSVQNLLDEGFTEFLEQNVLRSLLIVPMRARGGVIGLLSLSRFEDRRPFAVEDQDFAQEVADRAALAVENARLAVSYAQRARETDALQTATAALLKTLDLETLLGHIMDAALSAIPAAERGALHLIASDTGELQIRAEIGYGDPRILRTTRARLSGYALQAVHLRRPRLISDLLSETNPISPERQDELRKVRDSKEKKQTVRSVIVAPLIFENNVLGVLVLSSTEPNAFQERDLHLLTSFAATTTTAIQNATLHSQVQRQAITDALTEIYNRRGFEELGRREIERARRFRHPLAVIMLDVDHFKNVNDDHGHAVGDQVLQSLADRLMGNLREVDVLCRYGGEEFAILLPETDLFTAVNVAERLRRSVADTPVHTDAGPQSITISLGVSKLSDEASSLETLLQRSDEALYNAKQGGRNRVEVK